MSTIEVDSIEYDQLITLASDDNFRGRVVGRLIESDPPAVVVSVIDPGRQRYPRSAQVVIRESDIAPATAERARR